MSKEFITFIGRGTKDEDKINFIEKCSYGRALGIPKDGDKNFHVVFVECLINQFQDIMQSMSKNEMKEDWDKHPADRRNEEGVPLELVHQMRELSDILQYMINCASWRSGQYHSFDALTLQEKIERAATISNVALNR